MLKSSNQIAGSNYPAELFTISDRILRLSDMFGHFFARESRNKNCQGFSFEGLANSGL